MRRPAVLLILFLVNACSLVFEVVASRKAATYLGATAQANAVLLAAFLAGIGLGGWVAGSARAGTRRAGWMLVGAGLLAAAVAPALTLLDGAGPSPLPARGLLLALAVTPVGFAVGYAYPALTALYAASAPLGRSVASTYAADTVGAAVGAAGAGLVIVPALGLRMTGLLAGVGLCAAGLAVLRAAEPESKAPPRKTASVPAAGPPMVLGLFFATGVAALALEVAWIRLFTLVIGTSIFSFSLTVAAFLAAIGVGSQLVRSRVDGVKNPLAALSLVLLATGAAAPLLLVLSPVWERLYLAAHSAIGGFPLFQAAVFGLGLASILIPAGLMGAGFSLGVRLLAAREGEPGAVGRLYGVNTLGGVAGALLGGLVLIPALGLRGTVLLASAAYLVAGGVLGRRSLGRALRTQAAGACALIVPVVVWYLPEPRMFYAPYYHGLRVGSYEKFAAARDDERLLYRGFSPYGVITVSEDSSYRYLRHNGRSEASSGPADMSTQLLIAHLPMLMHRSPERVLNIGLGAGFTLAAITHHHEPRVIVQAELDPQIAHAARTFFGDLNDGAMEDLRLDLHVTDGRKLLAADPATYDVIISEPSHLWVSGVSGLFTTEFYRLAASRLAPGGIFATWVPDYEMGPDEIRIVATTLLDVFSHVVAMENGPSDIIFLGSQEPFRPTIERMEHALAAEVIQQDIRRALEGFPLSAANLHDLLARLAGTTEAMAASVDADVPRNTDDWPVLEFRTALAALSKERK